MSAEDTARVVDELYEAFVAGDMSGLLETFDDDIEFRFLGQVRGRGISDARAFFEHAAGLLEDLDFRVRRKIIDGDHAAVLWDETALTADGQPWANHGVDVYRVRDGRVLSLHENNDARLVHRHFERYVPPPQTAGA